MTQRVQSGVPVGACREGTLRLSELLGHSVDGDSSLVARHDVLREPHLRVHIRLQGLAIKGLG